jgi:hypothetical protein
MTFFTGQRRVWRWCVARLPVCSRQVLVPDLGLSWQTLGFLSKAVHRRSVDRLLALRQFARRFADGLSLPAQARRCPLGRDPQSCVLARLRHARCNYVNQQRATRTGLWHPVFDWRHVLAIPTGESRPRITNVYPYAACLIEQRASAQLPNHIVDRTIAAVPAARNASRAMTILISWKLAKSSIIGPPRTGDRCPCYVSNRPTNAWLNG